jgi:cytochrome c1
MTGGNPYRGKLLIQQYGCGGCHEIPGVDGANAVVGPPLTHIANRVYIAGKVANTPQNMQLWIINPQRIDPKNAMPNLGVTSPDSRDITAYLYTLQ